MNYVMVDSVKNKKEVAISFHFRKVEMFRLRRHILVALKCYKIVSNGLKAKSKVMLCRRLRNF